MGIVDPGYCSKVRMPCLRNGFNSYNDTNKPPGVMCADFFTVPDVMGTYPQTDFVLLFVFTYNLSN